VPSMVYLLDPVNSYSQEVVCETALKLTYQF
jgi:hypothetical protein